MMSMNFSLAFGAMICLVVLILGPGVFSLLLSWGVFCGDFVIFDGLGSVFF